MKNCIFVVLDDKEEEVTSYPKEHFEPTHLGKGCTYHVTEAGEVWFLGIDNTWVPSANNAAWLTKNLVPIAKPVDPFAELKQAFAEGKTIELNTPIQEWAELCTDAEDEPNWCLPVEEYRIKPRSVQPHKHAELIKAWTKGAEIEFEDHGAWFLAITPAWNKSTRYRIKPSRADIAQQKIDVLLEQRTMQMDSIVELTMSNAAIDTEIKLLREKL